jgi:hypothetical protein
LSSAALVFDTDSDIADVIQRAQDDLLRFGQDLVSPDRYGDSHAMRSKVRGLGEFAYVGRHSSAFTPGGM